MDNKTNKYIAAQYKLYDVTDGKSELVEETTDNRPFDFISGLGITIPAFEEAVVNLNKGDNFEIELKPEEAYGPHVDERILDLDKNIFCIDGKFETEHIKMGTIVPLQNADGNRFNGVVLEIGENTVKIDLNHPLAGRTLLFKGSISESRLATNEEVAQYISAINGEGEGCSGNCGHCGGHHHENGEGCCGGNGDGEGCNCGGHCH